MIKFDRVILEGVTTLVAYKCGAPSTPKVVGLTGLSGKHLVTRGAPSAGHWVQLGVPENKAFNTDFKKTFEQSDLLYSLSDVPLIF